MLVHQLVETTFQESPQSELIADDRVKQLLKQLSRSFESACRGSEAQALSTKPKILKKILVPMVMFVEIYLSSPIAPLSRF
jgi:hypothetical protein